MQEGHLGIYIDRNKATVVCLTGQEKGYKVVSCFSVNVEKQQEAAQSSLAELIAQRIAEIIPREYQNLNVAVALDCAMYMQHSIQSEFVDPKKIAQTIKFDTEEVLATDVSDVAVAFKIKSSDQSGSELSVFTTQKQLLSDVLLSLQANNIDPATVEPDVCCLSRFLSRQPQVEGQSSFYAMLSKNRAYFITTASSFESEGSRTFLISPAQNRNDLLIREIPITIAALEQDQCADVIQIIDSENSVNSELVAKKLGVRTDTLNLFTAIDADSDMLSDCPDLVAFAVAYGAALVRLDKSRAVNFRSDFMPYQGKKEKLRKTVKFLSISITVLMLAFGFYLQLQLIQRNGPRRKLREKFAKEYSVIMMGEKFPEKVKPNRKLSGELRRIRNVKSGKLTDSGQDSISAKLTFVLDAFNKCASKVNLRIDSISITEKDIRIVGDTTNRKNTLKLLDAMRESGLEIVQNRIDPKAGQDKFTLSVTPKR